MIASSPAYEIVPCPVCGGVDLREIASREAVRAEVEALWEFHLRRLRPETPPERLVDRVAFSHPPPFRVVQCRACGLVFRNPRERAFELAALYEREAPTREAMQALHDTQVVSCDAQARRLAAVAGSSSGSGIEIGSFVGGFLGAARARGWTFEGLDVNEDVNAFVREQGYRVTTGELATFEPRRQWDAVAIWNTFDQLPDAREAATRARALLAPGGLLALRMPNGAFYARLRPKLDGPFGAVARALLAHNNLLTFPYRHGFTVGSLRRLLGDVGFRIVQVTGDALVPIADEWTHGWAAREERALKRALTVIGRAGPAAAPWIEVYARAV